VGARQILTISIKMLVLALKLDAKDLFYLLAWFSDETNLCCAEISAAFLILLSSFLSFLNLCVYTDGQTNMARSTGLVPWVKKICTYFIGTATHPPTCYMLYNEDLYSTRDGFNKLVQE